VLGRSVVTHINLRGTAVTEERQLGIDHLCIENQLRRAASNDPRLTSLSFYRHASDEYLRRLGAALRGNDAVTAIDLGGDDPPNLEMTDAGLAWVEGTLPLCQLRRIWVSPLENRVPRRGSERSPRTGVSQAKAAQVAQFCWKETLRKVTANDPKITET
jgi:hypothetical protein